MAGAMLTSSDSPIGIPSLQGYYYPGTSVMLQSGLIVYLKCNRNALGTTVEVEPMKRFSEAQASFKIVRQPITEPNLVGLNELVTTGKSVSISVDDIQELVFIFHAEKLIEDFPQAFLHGMENVFVCRYDHQGNTHDTERWATFPSDMEVYKANNIPCQNSDIWRSLIDIQYEMHKILGRVSEKQGLFSRNRSNLRLSLTSWYYIRRVCNRVPCHEGIRKSRKRLLSHGLQLSSVQKKASTSLIRFETEADIKKLVSLFGTTVVADVRKRRPRIGVTEGIDTNDAINVIVGESDRETPYVRLTSRNGVEFDYDGGELVIRVRYRLYQLQHSYITGEVTKCPSAILLDLIERNTTQGDESPEEDDDEVSIKEDDDFAIDGLLYRVLVSHRNSHVTSKCIYPIRGNNRLNELVRFDDLTTIRELINKNRIN
jgi:hypothetical protein